VRVLARHRVEPDLRVELAFVAPEVMPRLVVDDRGAGLLELRGQPVLPHPRVLDQVIID
jgi:hypothetical protein